jgi:hypothetical protein
MGRCALLSLLVLGALGLVTCDEDDETATAETEVITSDYAQGAPGRGPTAVAGDACRQWRKGPGDLVVEINALRGVIRCREARRVLKSYYRDPGSNTRPWSCEDYGEQLVQCMKPGDTAFNGVLFFYRQAEPPPTFLPFAVTRWPLHVGLVRDGPLDLVTYSAPLNS